MGTLTALEIEPVRPFQRTGNRLLGPEQRSPYYLTAAGNYLTTQVNREIRSFGPKLVERELKLIQADRARRILTLLRPFTPDRRLLILDAGCGLGDIAFGLARYGHQVIGVDTDPAAIEVAKIGREELGAESTEFHAGYSAIQGRRFDVVVCHQVLEHVSSPESFLGSIREYLAPKGPLYLTTPNRIWPVDPHSGRVFRSWFDVRLFTWRRLRRVLSEEGFDIHEMTSYVFRNFALLYDGPEHLSLGKYWVARMLGRWIPRPFGNLVTESFFVVATRRD